MLLIPHDHKRANARPPSPMRAAAGCCAAINVGAAPVLMDEAPVPVPVTLPFALALVSPVALALLVATASTEAAVIVNVAFHAVQV